jgi:hypothetical protein
VTRDAPLAAVFLSRRPPDPPNLVVPVGPVGTALILLNNPRAHLRSDLGPGGPACHGTEWAGPTGTAPASNVGPSNILEIQRCPHRDRRAHQFDALQRPLANRYCRDLNKEGLT